MCLEPDTIWVNTRGRRYIDEGYILQFFAYGHAVARQPEGLSYTLSTPRWCAPRSGTASTTRWRPAGSHPTHTSRQIPFPGLERELRRPHDLVKTLIRGTRSRIGSASTPRLSGYGRRVQRGLRPGKRPAVRQEPKVPEVVAHAALLRHQRASAHLRHGRRHQDRRDTCRSSTKRASPFRDCTPPAWPPVVGKRRPTTII